MRIIMIFLFLLLALPALAFAERSLAWNGREIKGWVCDGKELKPRSCANSRNTGVIVNGKAKPKSGANSPNTWNVGSAPILVIAGALVLHLY